MFGLVRGFEVAHVGLDVLPVLAFAALAMSRIPKRLRSVATSRGLMTAAAELVHLADGRTEAHFPYFVLLGVLALYDDWIPYASAVLFVLVEHGVTGALSPESVGVGDGSAQAAWSRAGVHGAFVLGASVVAFVSWREPSGPLPRTASGSARSTSG